MTPGTDGAASVRIPPFIGRVFHGGGPDDTSVEGPDMLPRTRRHGGLKERVPLEIDPVCGMEVDAKAAEAAWEYEGVTYYFCSRGCLTDFREDPGSYLS